MPKFHDLYFEKLEDELIHLEQQSSLDDPNVIHLHPEQLLCVARQLCGMKPETAEKVKDLERKLAVLDNHIAMLVLDEGIRTEIIERCGSGIEIILRLDALYDLGVEFTAGLKPDYDHPILSPKSTPKENLVPPRFNSFEPYQTEPKPLKTQPSATVQATGQLGLAV